MILRELCNLYDRLLAAGEELPRPGRSRQNVSFRIILTPDGSLVRIEDARVEVSVTKKGKDTLQIKPAALLLLGRAKPPGSGLNPCFLWDNAGYLLGYVDEKTAKPGRVRESFEKLRSKHLEMEHLVNEPEYSAVCRFLEHWAPADSGALADLDKEALTANGVFRIQGKMHDVHEAPGIVHWWGNGGANLWWGGGDGESGVSGLCLVTNELAPLAIVHEPAIKGVVGAQTSGAKLVSYNCKAFESYGKEQSANAPVSEMAAFAYCNALNYLLADRRHNLRIGETTIVFWTDAKENAGELNLFAGSAMDPGFLETIPDNSEDAGLRDRVKKSLEELASGLPLSNSALLAAAQTRFFILGLSPNAARLSVRFYLESTFGEFLENQRTHFEGLRLGQGERPVISPYWILRSSVRDVKEIPPLYGGSLMRAILFGTPYPDTIAMSMLRRFKADGDINHTRCAYLKAWLNRLQPTHPITTMLDPTNTEPGYLLGRLFAVLTKTQEDALPGINRTIREAYYASASATPGSVFPRLLRLYTHHIAKLEGGRKVVRERQMQEIMSLLGSMFPARLNLREQGAFALGFYQQTQAFYTKNEAKKDAPSESQGELPL